MPVEGPAMVIEDGGMPYSFALEYEGPPIPHRRLPRAVPIDVYKIPVADVVPQSCLSDNIIDYNKLAMPVVQPILASDILTNSKLGTTEPIVYPTSSISHVNDENNSINNETVTTISTNNDLGTQDSVFISSGEFSDVTNSSNGSSLASHDHSYELSGGGGSSEIGFSDSFDNSRNMSGNSNPDWASKGSRLSFEYPASLASLKDESVCNQRSPFVTFHDTESENEFLDDSSQIETRVKGESKVKTRKGACYRCMKGNRFTEKEVCIVCNAKYCCNCVLRAMGSMPEGRKCVACIGFPINESKRGNLGKCSRMLKHLLNSMEITQIMKAEKLCAINQFPSKYVCVNRKPLSHEELHILQNCSNPPKKLKPGNYWYDKVSGLWGKEGEKPCKIISPHLNAGGPLLPDASNGNTGVFINGREITKVELRMLQLSGVHCAGNPHFWVNEDGSYQEEGQKNKRGYIWGKAGTKLVCALLSLPVPPKSCYINEQQAINMVTETVPDYFGQDEPQKILLTGYRGSGTSTIFKQVKILYKEVPFTEDERDNIKLVIQSNVYGYLGILLEGRERFEEEALVENNDANEEKTMYSLCPRLKAFSDWLLQTMLAGDLEAVFPVATRDYTPLVEELWNHRAVQATYGRRSELETLPCISGYFLEQVVNILRTDYIPTDVDILYAEHITSSNGLSCVDFSFPDSSDQNDCSLSFQLIRMQARGFGENYKWLEMFEDVQVIIFCVSLTDYDQYTMNTNGHSVNKMLLSRRLFETIVTHPTYDQMNFVLVLNKFDIFEEKLEQVPLTSCAWFNDFHPVVSRNSHNKNISSSNINHSPSMGQMASHYVAVKFKRLFSSLTGRKLFVSVMNGLEPDSVDQTLKYAREILKWDEEKHDFSFGEYSMYSSEPSSCSS